METEADKERKEKQKSNPANRSINPTPALNLVDGQPLFFPDSLAGDGEGSHQAAVLARPLIRFSCFERRSLTSGGPTRHRTYFPCPSNIAINDGANYSQQGFTGINTEATLAGLSANPVTGDGMFANVSTLISNTMSGMQNVSKGKALADKLADNQITQGFNSLLGESVSTGDLIKFGAKVIRNPNTNTTFGGNNVRSFTFNFKMIPDSSVDSDSIKLIHQRFRRFMYADRLLSEGTKTTFLRYPPVWAVQFLNADLSENEHIPKLFSCYLTNCSVTFNSTQNTFHSRSDQHQAPGEVDMNVTFQETRALTRADIDIMRDMSSNADDPNNFVKRGINQEGLASTMAYDQYNANPVVGQVEDPPAAAARVSTRAMPAGAIKAKEAQEANTYVGDDGLRYYNNIDTSNAKKRSKPSDIRLKENIYEVDVSPSGIKIYEFKYIDGVDRYRGVMAQDLLQIDSKHPAVSKDTNGFYVVNYGLIDVNMEKIK